MSGIGKGNSFEEEVQQIDMSYSGSAKKAEEPELIRANAISIEIKELPQVRAPKSTKKKHEK